MADAAIPGRSGGWPTDLIARIEALQERAYALTDTPLEAVLADVAAVSRVSPESPSEPDLAKIVMPELPFDTSEGWFEAFCSCAVSKYDRLPFSQRFWNIVPLCHEVLAKFSGRTPVPIALTALPFYDLGGHACRFEDGSHAVFLNEGMLGALPILFKYLMPVMNSGLFGAGVPGRNLSHMIQAYLLLSRNSATLLSHAEDSEDLRYPHAFETWYVDYLLQYKLMKQDGKRLLEPWEVPLNVKQALFLACRGAYVFVLAHEFAHIYLGHHEQLQDPLGRSLRREDELERLYEEFEPIFSSYGVEAKRLATPSFMLHQPLEHEADSLALLCVLQYIDRNQLDDSKAECVIEGVFALFFLMEWTERLLTYARYGGEALGAVAGMPWAVRNALVQGTHPASLSRLRIAMERASFLDVPEFDTLRERFGYMDAMFDLMWQNVAQLVPRIAGDHDLLGLYGVDRMPIFGRAVPTHFKPSVLERAEEIEALFGIGLGTRR